MSFWLGYTIFRWALRLGMVLVILRRGYPPATALTWIAAIFFIPELGLVLYLLVGESRLSRKRVRRYQQALGALRTEHRRSLGRLHVTRPQIDPAHLPVVIQAERISGMPILGGNEVELLAEPQATIDRLITDIDAARDHVHLLFYIFEPDATGRRVADALVRARQRGVKCRVLADAAGSRLLFRAMARELNERGVETYPILPVNPIRRRLARLDLRNHRKLAVVDAQVAYTGSRNVVDPEYGHRRAGTFVDMMARMRGPIVSQFQMVFLDDWYFDTGEDLTDAPLLAVPAPAGAIAAQAVPTGPTQETESLVRVILAALNAAQRKVIITSPYLVPDEPTSLALFMAADRGVEVNLVLPQASDHPLVSCAGRAYYTQLLESGVRIYQFMGGMLHAKTITVDDTFALLGSSNLDVRSFYLNFELNVLLYGEQITRELRFAQMRYIAESEPIDLALWRRRPVWKQYRDNAAALLSPLL